jgi:CRP-like cAMP-binding protein
MNSAVLKYMSKYNHFFSITLLNSIHPLSKSLNKYLSNVLISNHYKKGEHIVKSGGFCDQIHVIRKGLLRGYFDYNNKDITTWVRVDNEFLTSISGYFKKEPAQESIQCLEDTFTESIGYDDMQFALKNFKEMKDLYRILMEQYYVHAEYRAFMARISSAKDRYEYYLKITNPEIVSRLPKKYLASLLNMRPETLSRLKV